MSASRTGRPVAIVFDCRGAAEGAINVVRSLGRRGVPVYVVTDDPDSICARSRYCRRSFLRPGFSHDPGATAEFLVDLARTLPVPPVVFPTADPDLLLLSRVRDRLEPHVRHFLASAPVIEALSDKSLFIDVATRLELPVPATLRAVCEDDVFRANQNFRFPVVIKPSHPAAWTSPAVQAIVGPRKALIAADTNALFQAWHLLAPHSDDLILQEYITGPDDMHFSLHAFIDRDGNAAAWFTGRKVRVYPAYAGSGSFVTSVTVEPMARAGLEALRRIGATGIAVVNFRQDVRTGDFRIHEINPRVSQWNALPTRCGVDIPWLAYSEAAGLPAAPPGRQREGVAYLHFKNDFKAFLQYRQRGDWTWAEYLRTLRTRPLVHQLFALDDLPAFAASLGLSLSAVWRRIFPRTNQAASRNCDQCGAGSLAHKSHAVPGPSTESAPATNDAGCSKA